MCLYNIITSNPPILAKIKWAADSFNFQVQQGLSFFAIAQIHPSLNWFCASHTHAKKVAK